MMLSSVEIAESQAFLQRRLEHRFVLLVFVPWPKKQTRMTIRHTKTRQGAAVEALPRTMLQNFNLPLHNFAPWRQMQTRRMAVEATTPHCPEELEMAAGEAPIRLSK